jgi:truncated hemoglobin YjbI
MNSDDFKKLGGREILIKFSKIFYDKVYDHPWLKKYFEEIPQETIEIQQVDFLQSSLGGEQVYCGKLPVPAHKHMMITEELYELRSELVLESLKEIGANPELIEKINKIDQAFRPKLVKKSIDECEKRFKTDIILDFPNPNNKKAA